MSAQIESDNFNIYESSVGNCEDTLTFDPVVEESGGTKTLCGDLSNNMTLTSDGRTLTVKFTVAGSDNASGFRIHLTGKTMEGSNYDFFLRN